MRVVFVTHNELGRVCIEKLAELGADIQAVYTRPERDHISDQTRLEPTTQNHGIPLKRVASINSESVKSEIAEYDPELLFVIGWSQLVESDVLDLPSVASLGMHPAPLPRGRGRAPLAWSIIKGLDETALSFFHLTEEADAGDLVGEEPIPIDIEDDAASVYDKMIKAGKTLIQKYYPKFESGVVPREPQNDSNATWWPKREPYHGLIDWNQPPRKIYDWIRGQTRPYPGSFSYIGDTKITIWAANPPNNEFSFATPGEIIRSANNMLEVGGWEGTIELTEVQVQEDEPINASKLVEEYPFEIGDKFMNAREKIVE